MKKIFVVEKFIWAEGIADAVKQEKRQPPGKVYLHGKWFENNLQPPKQDEPSKA
jgi:hypothetical protein